MLRREGTNSGWGFALITVHSGVAMLPNVGVPELMTDQKTDPFA